MPVTTTQSTTEQTTPDKAVVEGLEKCQVQKHAVSGCKSRKPAINVCLQETKFYIILRIYIYHIKYNIILYINNVFHTINIRWSW